MMKINVLLIALLYTVSVQANDVISGSLRTSYTDNLPNAISASDIFSDYLVAVDIDAGRLWVPGVGKEVFTSLHGGLEAYDRTEGLDRISLGASVAYRHKLGLGAYAPVVGVRFRADYRDYDSAMRDGWLYRYSVSLDRRFTAWLQASLTLTHEQRTADASDASVYSSLPFSGDVYDQENQELAADLGYTLPDNSLVTLRYVFRDGEVDASTRPGSAFFPYTKALARDDDLRNGYAVYLVDARTHAMVLDWNWALGRDSSLSARYERRIAHTPGDNTYVNSIFSLQLNRRF